MNIINWKVAAALTAAPIMAMATPAAAATPMHNAPGAVNVVQMDEIAEHKRHKRGRGHAYGHRNQRGQYYRNDYRDDYRDDRRYRDRSQPVYRDTRIWRGRDGQYYCRKEDGTTGLLIGAAVGGLIGNEVAGRGDRTLGAILGAAGGAILGRAIDRSNSRCR